ncbi:MAG: PmoA family protein [Verrucomicrobiales bacterium]|nr:PmoA family protein [Verrucomicrobiales bacterium]
MNPFIRLFLPALCLCVAAAHAADGYTVESIAFPSDIPPEVGAIEFDANGDLYVALRRGDILIARPTDDPAAFEWRHFANGFHNACGIHIIEPGHVIISQMAELTEVIDTDNDGVADEYKALSLDIGLSGNYHETMDICPDGEGGLYLAPGTASHNGPTFETPRGRYSEAGRLGRNYSSVEWRGWVLHWNREKGLTPISSGYRMHNGIERAPDGSIWCGDNEGDWRAFSPVYHVTNDSFSGHPSSLTWDSRFAEIGNPLLMPRLLLDDLWNKPAFALSRDMINSCAEPVFDTTEGNFGPFAGQMFIPDQSGEHIVRLMRELVDGAWQGAARTFIEKDGLRRGNNRLAFSPSGDTLYVGQTGRGWGNLSEGLQRIRYTGKEPFEVLQCALREDGFQLRFTRPIKDGEAITVERYRYLYGYSYGGDELETAEIELASTALDEGSSSVNLIFADTAELLPNHQYRIRVDGVSSKDGEAELSGSLVYTLNRLVRPETGHRTTIEEDSGRYRIEINGELFTEYHTEGFSNPILYPIRNAAGTGLTRDWPLREDGRDGESQDHPHHKSLFIGHQSVNGIDFWHEKKDCGTIQHARTIETRSGEDRALVKSFNQWKNADGEVIGSDTREMQFGVAGEARFIDLELNIHASHGDLTFGAMKDGLIGLRTHPDLRITAAPDKGVSEVFGKASNSNGITGREIWGEKADWVHYYGQVDGKDAGIAILAHPENPRSPTWWHARDYGLIAANPFAPEDIGGDGELILPNGESLTLRYRFLFHDQAPGEADIAARFEAYAGAPLFPRSLTAPIPSADGASEAVKIPENVIPRGAVISKVKRSVNGKKAKSPKVVTHGFVEGALFYVDRDIKFTKIPEYLHGGDLVRTYNEDKGSKKTASYQVTVTEPGMLHLLIDPQAIDTIPWLKGEEGGLSFEKTSEIVQTTGKIGYAVYTAEVDPGTYDLGDQIGGNFYSIIGVNRD